MSYIESNFDEELSTLILGCREGRRDAQEKLYKKLYPKMMSVVKRYTNQYQYHIAEEILNNGFLKVFNKIDSYKYEGSFEGWVRRIIVNSVYDYVRQNTKYMEKVVFVEKDEVINTDLASKMRYDELMKLVQQLPENTRAVFNMFVIEGLPHKEICEILKISEGTSKWHLFEARKILKQKIENLK